MRRCFTGDACSKRADPFNFVRALLARYGEVTNEVSGAKRSLAILFSFRIQNTFLCRRCGIMRYNLPIVILKETRKNGKRREYNPWTKDYCSIVCIGAFDNEDETIAFLQNYVERQVSASEHFGWKCSIDRRNDGWIRSYSCSQGNTEYTTLFYRRCANPNI